MFSADFILRGGLWVLGQAVLLLGCAAGGWFRAAQWQSAATSLAGWMLLLTAAALGLAGALSLGRNLTPFPQPESAGQLVQTGIYGLVRHPLYTAVFSAALGWALVRASWPALAIAVCLAPFFDAKARLEERHLRLKFPDYERYQERVTKRFIPWVY